MALYEALGTVPIGAHVVIEVGGDLDIIAESFGWIGPMLRDASEVELHVQGRAAHRLLDELQRAIDTDCQW